MVVEVEALFIGAALPFGLDACPGEREPVGVDAELLHERHVFGVAVVVVAGDVASVSVEGATRGMTEGVPGGRPAAALRDGALDLVGGSGGSPEEVVGEAEVFC